MSDKLMEAAKVFMLAYFDCFDGDRQPGDFDSDILGKSNFSPFALRPDWDYTIFYEALAQLIDEGLVAFEKRDNDEYYYWKVNKTVEV